MDTYVYSIEDETTLAETLYVNLTNRCTNSCVFCIRDFAKDIKGKSLWLNDETVELDKIIEQFEKFPRPKEVVFCGYGEPLIKIDLLKSFASYLKSNYDIKIRVNTNGHGNFVNKRNVIPELIGLVDEFSISLNASSEEDYNKISQPKFEKAFEEVQKFIQYSVKAGIPTMTTVVDGYKSYKLDLKKCEELANKLGAKFKVREWLNNGY